MFALVSAPIDTPCPLGSLANNALCGIDWRGNGTYTAEGITKLCEGLKGSAVISLRCAATPKCLLLCQRPLTQKRTLLRSLPCQKANTFLSEHTVLCLARRNLSALARKRTHAHAPFSRFSTSTQCRPPSSAAATSSCRTGGSRVLQRPSHPLRPPRHSLRYNNLNNEAKQAVKDAAGSGVDIQF